MNGATIASGFVGRLASIGTSVTVDGTARQCVVLPNDKEIELLQKSDGYGADRHWTMFQFAAPLVGVVRGGSQIVTPDGQSYVVDRALPFWFGGVVIYLMASAYASS